MSEASDPIIASNHADLLVRGKIHIGNLQSALGRLTLENEHMISVSKYLCELRFLRGIHFFFFPGIQPSNKLKSRNFFFFN